MDFNTVIGTTTRKVERGLRNGNPTHIIRAERFFATPPDDLWAAITQPENLKQWFAEVSGALELNGDFSVKNNASGKILECEPPGRLALTWKFGEVESWVTVEIKDENGGALMSLEHESPTDEKSEAHWKSYGPGATGLGWELGLLGLAAHLLNPNEPLLKAVEEWAGQNDGKSVLRQWAAAWGQAHISAGEPAQTAEEAADRTAAFYTGEA